MVIKCPRCNHFVSDMAPTCPHCGEKLFDENNSKESANNQEQNLENSQIENSFGEASSNEQVDVEQPVQSTEKVSQARESDSVSPQAETIPKVDSSDPRLSPQQTPPQATSTYSAPVAPHPSEIPYQEAKKSNGTLIGIIIILAVIICVGGWFAYQKFYLSKDAEMVEEQVVAHHSVTLYGTVDKYPITMSLNIDGSVVKGTYYYNKQGPDKVLTLSGVMNGSEMDIYESDENGRQTGHFKGHYSHGEYQGEFITMQGKSMYFRVTE